MVLGESDSDGGSGLVFFVSLVFGWLSKLGSLVGSLISHGT